MKEHVLTKVVTAISFLVVAYHMYAAFFPSGANWSAHHLAFYPLYIRLTVILLMLLVLVPPIQRSMLEWIERLLRKFNSLPSLLRRIVFLLMIACSVMIFWVGRERLMFLGDGYLVLRNLGQVHDGAPIPTMSFHDAPTTALILQEVSDFLLRTNPLSADELAFRWVSIGFGVGWVLLAWWFSRLMADATLDRALVILFVFGCGGIQLFFGYTEVYSPAAFMVLLFLVSSLAHLRKQLPFIVPSIVFGCLITTHLGMMVLFPAYCWLCYTNGRTMKIGRLIGGCLAMLGTSTILIAVSGFTLTTFLEMFTKGGSHTIPLTGADPDRVPYTMLSANHFFEVGNLLLLISPLVPMLLVTILVLNRNKIRWREVEWIFLVISIVCCGGFIFLISPDLGMSRDWDVFSLFTIAILVASLVVCFKFVTSQVERRRILWLAATLTVLHTIPWVAVNATEEKALERFGLLNDSRFWGKTAVTNSYDELASYYRKHGQLLKAREYYEKYVAVDSSNERILANCGSIYQDTNDDSSAIVYYERAIQHNTKVKTVYADLGKLYFKRDRFEDAINVTKLGLARGYSSADAFNSIGAYLISKTGRYDEAVGYFLKAIQLDSSYDNAYLNVGICCSFLHRYEEMDEYFTKFLEMRPDYPEADDLRAAIQKTKKAP